MKKLIIAGKEFESRLFLGTGKFNSNTLMEEAIKASGTEMVTVAMKRIELASTHTSSCCRTPRVYVPPKKPYSPHRWLAKPSVPTG